MIPRPERRSYWYPNDPTGELPPLWWYLAQGWPWLAWFAGCAFAAFALAYWGAPDWASVLLTAAVWFSVGFQAGGTYERSKR